MTSSRLLNFALLFSPIVCLGQAPAGWKTLHDKTNTCQIAVPADWSVVAPTQWLAQAPNNQGDVQVVNSPGKTVKPFNEMAQKALMVNKMIDNTPQRVFYSSQPTKSDQPITPYHVRVPGKDGTCGAEISVRAGISEDVVKKIAGSLAVAP